MAKNILHNINEGFDNLFNRYLTEAKKVNVERCKDILNNYIDWDYVEDTDIDEAINQLRNLFSEGVITEEEYDYIIKNWDDLLENDSVKDESIKHNKTDKLQEKCRKMTEAPDEFGLPTDDEIEQEYRAKIDAKKAETQKQRERMKKEKNEKSIIWNESTKTLTFEKDVKEITEKMVSPYRNEVEKVIIPNSVTSISHWAFYRCSKVTSVTIPGSVTSIGDGAFAYCRSLTDFTIPDTVTSIGSFTFSGCSGLASIIVGDGITWIGEAAFSSCFNLKDVTISNSVTSISDAAFEGCSELTNITIPDSVRSIGNSAFASCSRLTSIAIPNSVTSIGWSAFSGCDNLTDVYYDGSQEQWDNIEIDYFNDKLLNANIHFNNKNESLKESTNNEEIEFFDDIVEDSYEHFACDLGRTPTVDDILEDIISNYDQSFISEDTIEESSKAYRWIEHILNEKGLQYLTEKLKSVIDTDEAKKIRDEISELRSEAEENCDNNPYKRTMLHKKADRLEEKCEKKKKAMKVNNKRREVNKSMSEASNNEVSGGYIQKLKRLIEEGRVSAQDVLFEILNYGYIDDDEVRALLEIGFRGLLDEKIVNEARKQVSDIEGTVGKILQKHQDELSQITGKRDAIALIDKISNEIKDRSYLDQVKRNLENKNDWGAIKYLYDIILAGLEMKAEINEAKLKKIDWENDNEASRKYLKSVMYMTPSSNVKFLFEKLVNMLPYELIDEFVEEQFGINRDNHPDRYVVEAKKNTSDIEGTIGKILQKHKDEFSKVQNKKDILDLLDKYEGEIEDKKYLEKVKMDMQRKNDFAAIKYVYDIFLAGDDNKVRK